MNGQGLRLDRSFFMDSNSFLPAPPATSVMPSALLRFDKISLFQEQENRRRDSMMEEGRSMLNSSLFFCSSMMFSHMYSVFKLHFRPIAGLYFCGQLKLHFSFPLKIVSKIIAYCIGTR